MPRARTNVTLTLPPEVMQVFTDRAQTHDETVEDYLTRVLTNAATAQRDRSLTPPAPALPARGDQVVSYWKKKTEPK